MSDIKVLIVDDSSTMRRIIKNALQRIGYTNLDDAENGKIALDKCEGVGLILTDWNMPEMDGLEFIKQLRAKEETKKVPIIMITTEAAKDDIVEAITAGVNDYIVKPFTPDTLKEKIDKCLSNA